MSWGTELWDQIGNLEKHTEKGMDFVEKVGHFVKERQRIEVDYASSLKKLYKSYFPKKKEEEDYKYSAQNAFRQVLQEVNSIANQHELIAEYLVTNVLKELQVLMQEIKGERKKLIQEYRQEDNNLDKSIKKMENAKGVYKHAHEAWVQAKQNYERANDDMNQTKAQVEKARQNMNMKNQTKDKDKDNYILQLDITNKDQKEYYHTKIPDIFNKLQEMDERRTAKLGEFYKLFAEGHRTVIPLINNCLDTMTTEANLINPTGDAKLTIDRYKTGHVPPDDIPMQDYDEPTRTREPEPDTISQNSTLSNANGMSSLALRKRKAKGTIWGMFGKKEEPGVERPKSSIKMKIPHTPSFRRKEEPKEDFSHLPPNQQSKKLKEKIDELSSLIESEVKSKEGLQRMREVYTKNPTLGDPASVDRQLAEIGKKMDGLRLELSKYQNYLAHAEGKAPTPQGTPQTTPKNTPHSTPQPVAKSESPAALEESDSQRLPPCGADTPQIMTENDGEPMSPGWAGQASFEEDPIGKCRALYEFQTDDENLLGMAAHEELDLIEQDSGDGWTRVRRGEEEGYVPTSYIELLQ